MVEVVYFKIKQRNNKYNLLQHFVRYKYVLCRNDLCQLGKTVDVLHLC